MGSTVYDRSILLGIIHSLQLDKNTIAVLLDDPASAHEDEDENIMSEERKKTKKIKVVFSN